MEKSQFVEYIQKFFKGIVLSIVKKLNGEVDADTPRYRFKEMLKPKFSITGKWETLIGNYRNVKADLVAMDSPLPIKKRASIGKASGNIPKSGMKKWLNETQMTNLQTLQALGEEGEVVGELFEDTASCITGVYENNEFMFLHGLSTGTALVTDDENVGTAARLDYGYLDENKFGVGVLWSNPATATPIDDFNRMFKKAKGKIKILMMDPETVRLLGATTQMKEQYAFFKDMVFQGSMPNLPLEKINEYMKSQYKVEIDIVDRSIEAEKDGNVTDLTPWQEGMIIGIPNYNVGDLVYAKTAEQNAPVEGVEYQLVDGYALISKYRKNEPAVSEHTQIQARVMPVITNVTRIFQMDTKTIQA